MAEFKEQTAENKETSANQEEQTAENNKEPAEYNLKVFILDLLEIIGRILTIPVLFIVFAYVYLTTH